MTELNISDVEAFQGASSVEAGDVEVIAYSGGDLPVVLQDDTTVTLVDTTDTEVDPAEEPTLQDVLTELQGSLDVSAVTVPVEQQTPVSVEDTNGTGVDPAEEQTLQSVVSELQSALDVSGATVPTDEQGPVGVENTGNTQIDPATEPTLTDVLTELQSALDVSGATVPVTTDATDAGPYTDRTTAVSTTVSVAPGRFGGEVNVVVDATGQGTLTVGVSNDGGTTVDTFTRSYDASGLQVSVPGRGYVEASANQNINAVTISTKGV